MSRKYSAWASNPSSLQADFSKMKLSTVTGNEQNQLKNFERVDAVPHMYVNVDAPPPPFSSTRIVDVRSTPKISQFSVPTMISTSSNMPAKLWPVDKSSKYSSSAESEASVPKRSHKHRHHHHHHHHHHRQHQSDKHRHHQRHRHHSQRHRAKSAESIRNRAFPTYTTSTTNGPINSPSYIEQDQQQPIIVYRELPDGDGYTVDPNGFPTVPYSNASETAYFDDQQAPMFVYPDGQMVQSSYVTDGTSQQVFYNQEQETNLANSRVPLRSVQSKIISSHGMPNTEHRIGETSGYLCTSSVSQQSSTTPGFIQEIERIYVEDEPCSCHSCMVQHSDPMACLSPTQCNTPNFVYCTEPGPQEIVCATNNPTIVRQNTINTAVPQQQQQQQQFIYLDNSNSPTQPAITNQIPVFSTISNNTTSQSIIAVPQTSIQRTGSMVIPQPQSIQVLSTVPQLQLLPAQQTVQVVANPTAQQGQLIQLNSATPQYVQAVQPQLIQVPTQTVSVPLQNQPMVVGNVPAVTLNQQLQAQTRVAPTTPASSNSGPNMFRHALLRTVADRTGVPLSQAITNGGTVQVAQTAAAASSIPNTHSSASLPIVPLTPGGLLIPFNPTNNRGFRGSSLPRTNASYPSVLSNFSDIRERLEQQRAQLEASLQKAKMTRIPSPPVISAGNQGPYRTNSFATNPSGTAPYRGTTTTGINYSPPSFVSSSPGSISSSPPGAYRSVGAGAINPFNSSACSIM